MVEKILQVLCLGLFLLVSGGCATKGAPKDAVPSRADVNGQAGPGSSAYEKIFNASPGTRVAGVDVQRGVLDVAVGESYDSASGKQCRLFVAVGAEGKYAVCRADDGELNLVVFP